MTAMLRLKSVDSMGRRAKRGRPSRFRRRSTMENGGRNGRRGRQLSIPLSCDEIATTEPSFGLDSDEVRSNFSPELAELGGRITERITTSLSAAMKSTEQAVLAIGSNISALFDIAKMSNDQATASLSGLVGKNQTADGANGNSNSLQCLLDRQRKSIGLLINRSQRFVQHQARLIEESNARFRRMKSSIAKISSFTSGSRLLAMNAHIESTRLGPHGKAFAIVAGEMKKLSGQIKEANDEIEGSVKRVSVAMQRLHGDATDMEDELASFSEKLAAEVADIERRSLALTDSLSQTLSQITASNEELMKHSLTAMSELQFQDPLTQALLRTGHEIRKMHSLLAEGKCQDLDLADINDAVGHDGTEHRPAGEIEMF